MHNMLLQKKLQEIGPPPDEEPPEIPSNEMMVSRHSWLIMCDIMSHSKATPTLLQFVGMNTLLECLDVGAMNHTLLIRLIYQQS